MKMKIKIKIKILLGKWVYWVWFYPKSVIFLSVFHFLKAYSPNPFFWVFFGGFDRFFGLTQPVYTPSGMCRALRGVC